MPNRRAQAMSAGKSQARNPNGTLVRLLWIAVIFLAVIGLVAALRRTIVLLKPGALGSPRNPAAQLDAHFARARSLAKCASSCAAGFLGEPRAPGFSKTMVRRRAATSPITARKMTAIQSSRTSVPFGFRACDLPADMACALLLGIRRRRQIYYRLRSSLDAIQKSRNRAIYLLRMFPRPRVLLCNVLCCFGSLPASAQATHYAVKLTPDLDRRVLRGEERIEFTAGAGVTQWQKKEGLRVSEAKVSNGDVAVGEGSVRVRVASDGEHVLQFKYEAAAEQGLRWFAGPTPSPENPDQAGFFTAFYCDAWMVCEP